MTITNTEADLFAVLMNGNWSIASRVAAERYSETGPDVWSEQGTTAWIGRVGAETDVINLSRRAANSAGGVEVKVGLHCPTCAGTGEVVTDQARYLRPHDGDNGDEAVADCPDCDGLGYIEVADYMAANPDPSDARPTACTGCGSMRTDELCRAEQKSCCPDRRMVPVDDLIASLWAKAYPSHAVEAEPVAENTFAFDRYVKGVLMAEGVTVEHQTTLMGAMQVAARIAPRGPNGETPVLVYTHPSSPVSAEVTEPFQARVAQAHVALFHDDPTDVAERRDRFGEEANELQQALGQTREDAHRLVDYTYDRPTGEPEKEIGAAALTLASLCVVGGWDMMACAEADLAALQTPEKIAKVRAKRATRHGRGPLPGLDAALNGKE